MTIIRPKGNKSGKSKRSFTVRTYDKVRYNKMKKLLACEIDDIINGE